jgi:CRISPR-associated protein Cmr4
MSQGLNMSQTSALLWVHALSPLRFGTDEGLGAINLPTLREAHTQHPLVPGSSLKGVLRGHFMGRSDLNRDVAWLFGPERSIASDHRGGLSFGDARLVALPVRSLHGTFAWCTSPSILHRLNRDRRLAGGSILKFGELKEITVAEGSALLVDGRIFIEEFTTSAKGSGDLTKAMQNLAKEIWGEGDEGSFFLKRVCVVPDTLLSALCMSSMELRTRVCIDPAKGTAADSGPWTEEAMPAETLLVSLVTGNATQTVKRDEHTRALLKETRKDQSAEEAVKVLVDAMGAWKLVALGGHNSVGFGRASVCVRGA